MDKEREEERRKKLKGIIVAGALATGAATALTGCGKDEERKEENTTEYTTEYTKDESTFATTETTEIEEEEEERDIFEEIAEEHNSKYPENVIKSEDLGILRSPSAEYLIERKNDDGKITYIMDNKMLEELKEGEDFKDEGIGTIYTVVNKANKTTVFSMGYIDYNVEIIIPNRVKSFDGTEYRTNGEEINLGLGEESDGIDKANMYYKLEKRFEKRVKELEEENER